jgi:hypothetical protein
MNDVATLCLTHDWSFIPLKTLAINEGIYATPVLTFSRTSPDYGTALEIAGKGRDRPKSFCVSGNLLVSMVFCSDPPKSDGAKISRSIMSSFLGPDKLESAGDAILSMNFLRTKAVPGSPLPATVALKQHRLEH